MLELPCQMCFDFYLLTSLDIGARELLWHNTTQHNTWAILQRCFGKARSTLPTHSPCRVVPYPAPPLCQMAMPKYEDKVPEAVREANSKKIVEYETQKENVLKAIKQFERMK